MKSEEILTDIIDRLARLETKVDQLIQQDNRQWELSTKVYIALIGSVTSLVIAILF